MAVLPSFPFHDFSLTAGSNLGLKVFHFISHGIKFLLHLKSISSKNLFDIFCGKTSIRDLMNLDLFSQLLIESVNN